MKLIKSNSHNNGLEVYKSDGRYVKHAINEKGQKALNNEYQGYKWYGVDLIASNDRIIIPEFKGKTFPQYNKISRNEDWIEKFIRFYCDRWRGEKTAVHGDLCLCNIIFGDEIYVIDWEHFHWNGKEYFGFDIINMLFIHLHYEYRWWHRTGINWVPYLKNETREFIRKMVLLMGRTPFLYQPFTHSSNYITQFMDKDKFILAKTHPDILESLDWICA